MTSHSSLHTNTLKKLCGGAYGLLQSPIFPSVSLSDIINSTCCSCCLSRLGLCRQLTPSQQQTKGFQSMHHTNKNRLWTKRWRVQICNRNYLHTHTGLTSGWAVQLTGTLSTKPNWYRTWTLGNQKRERWSGLVWDNHFLSDCILGSSVLVKVASSIWTLTTTCYSVCAFKTVYSVQVHPEHVFNWAFM